MLFFWTIVPSMIVSVAIASCLRYCGYGAKQNRHESHFLSQELQICMPKLAFRCFDLVPSFDKHFEL